MRNDVLSPRPGRGHQLGGSFDVVVRVRAEQAGGVMAVIEETIPPGALITPHTHRNDVWVHVLTGEIGVLVGEQTASAGPGAWALKPRGVLHPCGIPEPPRPHHRGTDPRRERAMVRGDRRAPAR
jgi:quercetin dioxygenase-like cupin family protein